MSKKAGGFLLALMRKSQGLCQVKACNSVGISQPSLCRIEKGQREPSVCQLGRLADLYQLTDQEIGSIVRVYAEGRS